MGVHANVMLQNLPPYYENISRNNLERAYGQSLAQYAPFGGPRVAGMNPDLNRAEALGRQEGLYLPYMQQAQQGFQQAATPFPQNFQNYMNPYMQSVLDRLRNEGNRNFQENILPSLESRFVRGGAYGGSMHKRLAERAGQENAQAVADRQQQALASGYQQAGQLHASDMERQMQAARQMANLGQMRQAGHLADISALENQGERGREMRQQDLDVGYRDFLRQHEYPWQQMSNLSGVMGQTPHSSQGLQYMQGPAEQRWNRAGQIGQLAGQLYGLNRGIGGGGFKEGGTVKEGLHMKSGLASLVKKKKGVKK